MVIPPPERRDRDACTTGGSTRLVEQEYLEGVKGPAHLVPRWAVGAKNDDGDDDRELGWWNASATPTLQDDSAAAARQ